MTDHTRSPVDDLHMRDFLRLARVAHLATADAAGTPHNVPLCFWVDDDNRFYFIIDEKPKRASGTGIKRMRNIAANPRVALVIDHYEEDWASLAYVLVRGRAMVIEDPEEYLQALRNLRDKYPQYRAMALSPDKNPIVRVDSERIHCWGKRFESS